MPKLKITKAFLFAHRGCEVVTYQAGSEVDTDDQELIDTVLAEKWGHRPRARATTPPGGVESTEGDGADNTDGTDGPAADADAGATTDPAAQ